MCIRDSKIENALEKIPVSAFEKGYVIIKKGKKIHHKASFQS